MVFDQPVCKYLDYLGKYDPIVQLDKSSPWYLKAIKKNSPDCMPQFEMLAVFVERYELQNYLFSDF